ncbi:MAG TPA: hypothetical protein VNQ73_04730 [Ilumatobacter sp.]|nr:hypothetical protein [Ilumatobacter sp.]
MNDELDPQLEAALTDTFARRDREAGQMAGNVADVYRRAGRRRIKRRALTGVASVMLVGVGVGGLVAVGQIGSEGPARGAPDSPTEPTLPATGQSWFVCDGEVPGDGATLYEWCELETPYGYPAWSCTGPVADPAVDGDDRPRFQSCTAVGEAYEEATTPVCMPVVATSAPAVTSTAPSLPTAPLTTWVASGPYCVTSGSWVPVMTSPPMITSPPTSAWPSAPSTVPPLTVPSAPTIDTSATLGTTPTVPSLPTISTRVIAIGDPVMQGAADVLEPRGWTVVAQQGLQLADAVPMVEQMATNGVFAETQTVIVHLGTNGTFTAEQLDALLAPLAGVPNVLLYTVHADRSWTENNNAIIRARDQPGDNIALIDWAARAGDCPGDCFAADGIHLNAAGKEFYADLARDWTGTP